MQALQGIQLRQRVNIVYTEHGTPHQPKDWIIFTFHTYSNENSDAVRRLLKQLGYPVSSQELDTRIEHIRAGGGEIFVAKDQDHIAGCINTYIDVRLAEGICGEVVSLVVDRNYRGNGLGKQLLDHAEQWLLQQGCKNLRVRANAKRHGANQFYVDAGYEEVKTQKIFSKNIR